MKSMLSALVGALFLSFIIPAHAAPPKTVSSDRLIVPGERIGPLRLGGKIDEVVKLFGPGNVRGHVRSELFVLQTWDAIGLWVQFDSTTGNIIWISVEASRSYPWAEFSSREGIRLGARQEDAVSAMGPPERTFTSGGATSLYYDRRGIRLTLTDTGPFAGKVGSIRVVWPAVPRGDSLIVPGRRISNIEVGKPIDRTLKLLGGGYHRGESSPGVHVYYWPHLGLSLTETGGFVTSARASRQIPADALGIRYATADGLSNGSTGSNIGDGSSGPEIRKVFGEPPRSSPVGGLQFWIYDSRGILFALDDQQKVKGIDVFPSKGAIADYDRAIELDPKDANAHYKRGFAYQSKGDNDRAIADYDKAIELDPKDVDAYNSRGGAYLAKGEFDRAIANLDKAIELDPKDASAYSNRAWAYLKAGKAMQGLSDAEKSLDLRPDDPYALDTRGHIFEALGRREEAIADFRQALAKAPDLQESKEALKRLGEAP